MMSPGDLHVMGVTKLGVRTAVLQAVELLSQLVRKSQLILLRSVTFNFQCYNLVNENLQSLAMYVCVRARDLLNEIHFVLCGKSERAPLTALLSLLSSASFLVEEAKKIIAWLDRQMSILIDSPCHNGII